MSLSNIQKFFPGAVFPIICNGPMIGAASAAMAAEVSKAGGIGFLPCAVDLTEGSQFLNQLDTGLANAREHIGSALPTSPRLPVGIGFITGHKSIGLFAETALPIIKKHSPAAVWLFAPEEEVKPHGTIIKALRGLDAPPAVFVQVGNVTAAREAVRDGADVLVCQGVDAGGHQFRRGQGVVSLVPGVRQMLKDEFPEKEIVLLGAGGIADGHGVAAVMTLGASGVVMGTRFAVADESVYPDHRKQLILNTSDGGTETLKSPFNDQINNNTLWGPLYDGRGVIGPVHEKFLAGASLEECQRSLKDDYTPEEAVKAVNTWAGTGVGLVRKRQPAGEIVREVRTEAVEAIKRVASLV
ncbi:Nitronate monooxygenase-like protein [Hapsidospora chrysogenum ATCC 11550]|uniref:Nitronate monooxygenase-like protein n=1 Tax=Hapsidospora chrysogenum (strain ATCC 11550 / CBS 779.69 / DSM 880 / IAM 14645 / JCM 23072 / IMI 49137) TaxID=857340 RepID=A0A086SWR2_HAPC1|nr:Nitronate monooxygenase-like protein [Hapsidospora chrysogenum ATCC 11550]